MLAVALLTSFRIFQQSVCLTTGGRQARGRAALAADDGDSDLDERFGQLGVRFVLLHRISSY